LELNKRDDKIGRKIRQGLKEKFGENKIGVEN